MKKTFIQKKLTSRENNTTNFMVWKKSTSGIWVSPEGRGFGCGNRRDTIWDKAWVMASERMPNIVKYKKPGRTSATGDSLVTGKYGTYIYANKNKRYRETRTTSPNTIGTGVYYNFHVLSESELCLASILNKCLFLRMPWCLTISALGSETPERIWWEKLVLSGYNKG